MTEAGQLAFELATETGELLAGVDAQLRQARVRLFHCAVLVLQRLVALRLQRYRAPFRPVAEPGLALEVDGGRTADAVTEVVEIVVIGHVGAVGSRTQRRCQLLHVFALPQEAALLAFLVVGQLLGIQLALGVW
ncbi:hypothetical protein D3C78_1395120 [compost metagenome]